MKLKPSKCEFLRDTTEYLGYQISELGVRPHPRNQEAVRKFPIPKRVKDVRSFVGLVAYYRRFIPAMAAKAKVLTNLMTRDPKQKFEWTDECQQAFDILKAELISPKVMAYPDMTRAFYLETDASTKGLGIVLSQKDKNYKNHLRPILFGSHVLKDAET